MRAAVRWASNAAIRTVRAPDAGSVVSGREVNPATPAGPSAPVEGFIDTAEYDRFGNVIRSLDATSRLLALGQLPTATADLAALNLTTADTASRATASIASTTR